MWIVSEEYNQGMPPLPPNLTRAGILRTMPAWNQRTASRRDNHTRFLTKRFPVKPSSDTNWVNPSLPPGASRLAQHIGSTGHRHHRHRRPIIPPVTPEWLLLFDLSNPQANNTFPIGVSVAPDADRFMVGFPGADNTKEATVQVYGYSQESQWFVQVGNTITYSEADHYEAGRAVALGGEGTVMFVGVPSGNMVGTEATIEATGKVLSYKLDDDDNTWERVGPEEYDQPKAEGAAYGSSLSVSNSSILSDTLKLYLAEGVPSNAGDDTPGIYVSEHNAEGGWTQNIGASKDNAVLKGDSTSAFGTSVSISDELDEIPEVIVAIGAPGENGTDDSYVRIVKWAVGTNTWHLVTTIHVPTGSMGASVGISSDGTIVVAGDPANGRAYVYYSDPVSGDWVQLGDSIPGDASGTSEFGTAVAIGRDAASTELDGITIAVGEPGYNAPGRPSAGRVCVLEYAGGAWRSVLNPVVGLSENERFGETLAMSPDGQYFVAAGARSVGRVAVYGTSPLTD